MGQILSSRETIDTIDPQSTDNEEFHDTQQSTFDIINDTPQCTVNENNDTPEHTVNEKNDTPECTVNETINDTLENGLDSTGNSCDKIVVPSKLLCDNATQTEQLDERVCIDNSVQTNTEPCDNSVVHSESDDLLRHHSLSNSALKKCVQTDEDEITDDNIMGTSSIQTDDVIKEVESTTTTATTTTTTTTIDCSVQTEEVDGNLCKECSAVTTPSPSPQLYDNYLHCDIANESEEVLPQPTKDDLKSQSDSLEVICNNSISESESSVWKARYQKLEKQLEEEVAMHELVDVDHRKKLENVQEENSKMREVVEQYEQVMVELTEQSGDRLLVDATLSATIVEKEQVQQDLHKAEGNVINAYKRIEKLKLALDAYKQNEENMNLSFRDYETKLQKSEEKYTRLKEDASEKIDAANAEISKVRQKKETDLAGLQAALKKSQSRNTSLEKEIEQKVNETRELSQICDELIKRVSAE